MLKKFLIRKNSFLDKDIQSYYSRDYIRYKAEGNPDFINHLKNQFNTADKSIIQNAKSELMEVIYEDLPKIREFHNTELSVCVVPRAKAENYYSNNQKVFRRSISEIVGSLDGFEDCTQFIVRQINTRTTHMDMRGHGGDGDMPYTGITKATCNISNNIAGRNILLIDDVYTKGVNIDEDVIQTLLDLGANSVIFYAVGRTTFKKADLLKPRIKETFSALDNESDLKIIAHMMGVSKNTILGHIEEIVSILGSDSVMHIKPPHSTLCAVENAVMKVGRERWKPIFEELKGEVSYDDIRVSLMFIN